MERKAGKSAYRGKLTILFLVLACSNLGVNDTEWMTMAEAGCEECENLEEDITFSPASLELLEEESKTTTAKFTGGSADWGLESYAEWYSLGFDSSSAGVDTTIIRAQAGSQIPEPELAGGETYLNAQVVADPLQEVVPVTSRWIRISGLRPKVTAAPGVGQIPEGQTQTIRVGIANALPSSTWTFQLSFSPSTLQMISVDSFEKTGNKNAVITIRALDLSGCNKTEPCTKKGTMAVKAERASDKRVVRGAVPLIVYYRD